MKQENHWISLLDMMTGLMIIFMFIAIAYIRQIKSEQLQRDLIFEEFKATKDTLYAELSQEFKDDFKRWEVILDKDLSIKFVNPDVLFVQGKSEIRPIFKERLDDFLPRYFNILRKEKYRNSILEVRIEGHADTVPRLIGYQDSYMGNLELSQKRAAEVLSYFRRTEYFYNLPKQSKDTLEFWLTANGLSFGRTLDDDRNYSFISTKPINNDNSRRVEFRIVTNNEALINKFWELKNKFKN